MQICEWFTVTPTHCATNDIMNILAEMRCCRCCSSSQMYPGTLPDRLTDGKTDRSTGTQTDAHNGQNEIMYCVLKYCIKSLYLSINFSRNKINSCLLFSFFFSAMSLPHVFNVSKLLFFFRVHHKEHEQKSHKNILYCYLHIYSEGLCLDPRGRGPQIKRDNVHMKKLHHHHWTCITPFITRLTASFIFSPLVPANPGV